MKATLSARSIAFRDGCHTGAASGRQAIIRESPGDGRRPATGFRLAIGMAFAFAITNGFHDASNAIATLVATRVARPMQAILLAAVCNLLGPLLLGAAVADTIATIVTAPAGEEVTVVGAGLTGAVVWNLITWWRGIPSSSSHALVGGLVGAALATAGTSAVNWGGIEHGRPVGVIGSLIALAISPVLGFAAAAVITRIARRALRRASVRIEAVIRNAQWVTSGWLAFSHGANDAQKTVGIIAALLLATGRTATLDAPTWVIVSCSFALTIGTAMGGWSIVRTIGSRIVRLRPLDGLVSQASSAGVILASSVIGAPVSTSQIVSSSVVGIGVGRRRTRHVNWRIVSSIGIAWLTTMPAAATFAILSLPVWRWLA